MVADFTRMGFQQSGFAPGHKEYFEIGSLGRGLTENDADQIGDINRPTDRFGDISQRGLSSLDRQWWQATPV